MILNWRWVRIRAAALCALILLLVSAANAEQTVYVKSIDTSIPLPDGSSGAPNSSVT